MGAWVNGSIILQNRNFCNQKLLLSCKVRIGFFGHYFKDDYEESSGKIFEVFSVNLIHRIHCNFILIHSIFLGFFCLIFFFDFNNVYIFYCKISISAPRDSLGKNWDFEFHSNDSHNSRQCSCQL